MMAFLKALPVYMTILTSVLSLPFSHDDNAQVFCFASDLSAPTYDLTTAVYHFCAGNFPVDSISEMTTIIKDIKLDSGKTTCLTTVLDPVVPDWSSGDCIYLLLKTVEDCEVDGGVSTGGEYDPIESGASQFTVKVIESSDSARSTTDATLNKFDADDSMVIRGADTNNADSLACYSFDPAVLSNDLIVFLYSFCATNEPGSSTVLNEFSATKDYTFLSGNKARFSMLLHGPLFGYVPNVCVFYMLQIVNHCESADGYNTGGKYTPEHHESEWSITILGPLDSPKSLDASSTETTVEENSIAARQTSAEAYCFGASMDKGDLAVPIQWGIQTVQDFCKRFDGEILNQGFLRQYTVPLIVPNVWIAVRAQRSNTMWDAGCQRTFEIILNACHSQEWDFFGGQHVDEFNTYTIGIQDPPVVRNKARKGDKEGALVTRSGDYCYEDNDFPVPLVWGIGAVQEFCKVYDGLIMEEGYIRQHVLTSIVPHVWVSVRALDSNTLWDAACRQTYEIMLNACHTLDGKFEFFGGQHTDGFNVYSIGTDPPATSQHTNGSDENSSLASRSPSSSPSNQASSSFNATESTNAKFTSSCSNFPWSENPISIDYTTAQSVVDYLCSSYSNRPLGKDEQAPLTFLNTDPKLFANVFTSESVVLYSENCDWAYDTLFKACVWDGRFYGGEAIVEPVKWVLDFGPGVSAEKTIDSGVSGSVLASSAISSRDTGEWEDPYEDSAKNECYNVIGHTTKKEWAGAAATELCNYVGTKDFDEGDWNQYTLLNDVITQPIRARLEAYLNPGMDVDICRQTFTDLLDACSLIDTFFGGIETYEGFYWSIEVLDAPTLESQSKLNVGISGTNPNPVRPHPADKGKRENAGPVDCDDNEVSTDAFATYQRARDFCKDIGSTAWESGDGLTRLYQNISPWISARAVALESVNINARLCYTAFQTLINSCTTDFKYGGGKIDAHGVRWTFTVVPGSPPAESKNAAIVPRSDPYHDGSIDCVIDSKTLVLWPEAFRACIIFCRSMDGEIVTPGSPWQDLYELKESGGIWVTNYFEVTNKQVTMDYQTCIEMYDATIRKCRSGMHTSGGTNEWNGLKAEYKLEDWSTSTSSRRGLRNANCIRAESTPIDKQAAGEAISLFCAEFSGHTIDAKEYMTKTILVDGYNIGMRVTAVSNDGYMLYAQNCIAGFEQLVTECSDGTDDEDTVGGTLFAGDAAFTLSMVFV